MIRFFTMVLLFAFFVPSHAKTIPIIIPFSAGGVTALTWQIIEPYANQKLKQNGIVLRTEHLPGAGGGIGAAAALRRQEGTLVFTSTSVALLPLINPAFDYQLSDFSLVNHVGQYPLVLFASTQINTWQNLLVKCRKGPVSFGNSGHGSMTAVTGEAIFRSMGCKSEMIPYKSASQAMPDLVQGVIDTVVDHPTLPNLDLARTERIRPIMVLCQNRISVLPHVPCHGELAIDTDFANWHVLLANQLIDRRDMEMVKHAVNQTLQDQEVRRALQKMGMNNIGGTVPTDFLLREQHKFRQSLTTQ
jgi:tripartite-type tricarboxylate transporter receptor subunit TctC